MNIGNGIGTTSQALSLLSTASTNAAAQADATKQAAKANAGTSSPVAADATKLTSTAGLISLAVSGTDARSSQVQAIQAAIAAGTYHVPASAVADKLMESMFG